MMIGTGRSWVVDDEFVVLVLVERVLTLVEFSVETYRLRSIGPIVDGSRRWPPVAERS